MDLFSTITEDLAAPEDIDSTVKRICEFVKNLDEGQLKLVKATQEAREFEAWEKAARNMQAIAYKNGLKDEWWRIVKILNAERYGHFFDSAWDAAYDHSMAMLVKPWAGKSWSQKEYDLLIAPLEAAGFKE